MRIAHCILCLLSLKVAFSFCLKNLFTSLYKKGKSCLRIGIRANTCFKVDALQLERFQRLSEGAPILPKMKHIVQRQSYRDQDTQNGWHHFRYLSNIEENGHNQSSD